MVVAEYSSNKSFVFCFVAWCLLLLLVVFGALETM